MYFCLFQQKAGNHNLKKLTGILFEILVLYVKTERVIGKTIKFPITFKAFETQFTKLEQTSHL